MSDSFSKYSHFDDEYNFTKALNKTPDQKIIAASASSLSIFERLVSGEHFPRINARVHIEMCKLFRPMLAYSIIASVLFDSKLPPTSAFSKMNELTTFCVASSAIVAVSVDNYQQQLDVMTNFCKWTVSGKIARLILFFDNKQIANVINDIIIPFGGALFHLTQTTATAAGEERKRDDKANKKPKVKVHLAVFKVRDKT